MAQYTEEKVKKSVPVLTLHGRTAFPQVPLTIELSSPQSLRVCSYVEENNAEVFVVSDGDDDGGLVGSVGCTAELSHIVHLPDGNVRVMIDGKSRAAAVHIRERAGFLLADIVIREYRYDEEIFDETQRAVIISMLREFCDQIPKLSKELFDAASSIDDTVLLMDTIASDVFQDDANRRCVISEFDPKHRYEIFCQAFCAEIVNMGLGSEIHKQVRENLDRNQRDYYLREQLKVIQDELGYDEDDEEISDYIKRINKCIDDEKSREKLIKEANKLAKIPFGASEGTVIHAYLDTVLEYPWKNFTQDRIDIPAARKILDADHDGIEKVKERILEYLAVKKLCGDGGAQILCLVGAPGLGKTSVARSVARAMGRKFVRISLGGVRDEAEIRGHRRTYLGSMPGRIVAAITEAGVENPLILLDEIDKLTSDLHGDPSSALLEVLDSEQNSSFRDHFMEIPIDLSKCVFIATANTLDTVARPLLDRMEIIEMSSYTRAEKFAIARHHLIKKQAKANGIKLSQIRISDKALYSIIDDYTAEAGVRSLERKIAAICRKAAIAVVDGDKKSVGVTEANLKDFLTEPVIPEKKVSADGRVGVANGMAYTQYGGDLLPVETLSMPGSGKVILTGSLGDVMKESAEIAVSYIRSVARELELRQSFYRDTDIHVHFPEGAVPKDGPSAGVTVTSAIISELTGCPVRGDISMTGEISLKGSVLPIGGLREKTMAAYKAGVRTILIPRANEQSLREVDPEIKENVRFVLCSDIRDVLREALILDMPDGADAAERRRITAMRGFVRA